MLRVTLNGKAYECPACWADVTTEVYQKVMGEWDMSTPVEERDYFHLFCLLTGADFKSFIPSAELEVTIWNAIRWFVEEPFQPGEKPKVIVFDDKPIDIPANVGSMSIGANIAMKQILTERKYLEQSISMAMAVFLQPAITGSKFNLTKAREMESQFAKLPIYQTYPIGFFLLSNAATTGRSGTKIWHRIRRSLNWLIERASLNLRRSHAYRLTLIFALSLITLNGSALTQTRSTGKTHSFQSPIVR